MPDMLVNLLKLPKEDALLAALAQEDIIIRRAMTPDQFRIQRWVTTLMGENAAGECAACFARTPVSLFIATHRDKIIGFACYHATAPDFFGPTSVDTAYRGKGIGKALLIRALRAMREEGFAYAIIGGVGPVHFYESAVHATLIPDSDPSIYEDYLGRLESVYSATEPAHHS